MLDRMERVARNVAFAVALGISAVGICGVVQPSVLLWVAEQFVAAGLLAFYVIATVRIAFGLSLILAAPVSRSPKVLRVVGFVILILGIVTALAGSVAAEQSHAVIELWEQLSPTIVRLTAVALLALGIFVAYACAPRRGHAV